MSTDGFIARETETGFSGVYHDCDAYPLGLGADLCERLVERCGRDVEEMLKSVIDEELDAGGEEALVDEAVADETECDYGYVFCKRERRDFLRVLERSREEEHEAYGLGGWREIGMIDLGWERERILAELRNAHRVAMGAAEGEPYPVPIR
jgi:hypothetical protein